MNALTKNKLAIKFYEYYEFSIFYFFPSSSFISPFLLVASLRWLFFGARLPSSLCMNVECPFSLLPAAWSLCVVVAGVAWKWHDKKWTSHSQCWTTRKMSRNGNKISTSLPLFPSFFSSSRCCRYDVVAQRRTQSFTILPISRSSSFSTDSSWDLIKFYFKRQTMMSWEEIAAAVKDVNGVEIFFQFSPICKLLR